MNATEEQIQGVGGLSMPEAASMAPEAVLDRLGTAAAGLGSEEAVRRLHAVGPNAIRTHHARALAVLGRQFRSALLALLLVTAVVSAFFGERTDALIIGAILAISIGLGFVNEYRAERAVEALHEEIRHDVPTHRDGQWVDVDVTDLVPGDVVRLDLGMIVPADLRILESANLTCNEAVLTGEAEPVEKAAAPVAPGLATADLTSCAFMGTTVREGAGRGVVVATGGRSVFGSIALGLGQRQPETAFQIGLRRFSGLLARVAAVLTGSIFVVNLLLRRPEIDALLYSLAIAVGITPQLLPAVVTTSLATGSRRLARRKVLVKRLVGIEDLGNIEVLFTDKTGTLTEGHVTFQRATDPDGNPSPDLHLLGLLCNEASPGPSGAVGGNELDRALWDAPGAQDAPVGEYRRLGIAPFDHERRMTSVLVDSAGRGAHKPPRHPPGRFAFCRPPGPRWSVRPARSEGVTRPWGGRSRQPIMGSHNTFPASHPRRRAAMAEDSWLKMVADELMLHETQVDALIEAAFPGQLDVAAADVLAAGAYAREPVLLRRRILAASPEEPPESHGFWFRRTRR